MCEGVTHPPLDGNAPGCMKGSRMWKWRPQASNNQLFQASIRAAIPPFSYEGPRVNVGFAEEGPPCLYMDSLLWGKTTVGRGQCSQAPGLGFRLQKAGPVVGDNRVGAVIPKVR